MKFDILNYHIVTSETNHIIQQKEFRDSFYFHFGKNPNMYIGYNSGRISSITPDDECLEGHSVEDQKEIQFRTEWIGRCDSFLGAINMANINKWPYVFVFDDTAHLCDDFQTKVDSLFDVSIDYDGIILDPRLIDSQHLRLIIADEYTWCDGHGYFIPQKSYQKVFENLDSDTIRTRNDWWKVRGRYLYPSQKLVR